MSELLLWGWIQIVRIECVPCLSVRCSLWEWRRIPSSEDVISDFISLNLLLLLATMAHNKQLNKRVAYIWKCCLLQLLRESFPLLQEQDCKMITCPGRALIKHYILWTEKNPRPHPVLYSILHPTLESPATTSYRPALVSLNTLKSHRRFHCTDCDLYVTGDHEEVSMRICSRVSLTNNLDLSM